MTDRRLHPTAHLAAGSFCGGFSSIVLQPLDVIKTRLQIPETGGAYIYQKSMSMGTTVRSYSVGVPAPLTPRSIVSEIIRLHGISGLWRGTSATLLRTFPGVGTYFFMLSHTKEMMKSFRGCPSGDSLTPYESMMAGATARSLTGVLFFPATLLKARLESGLWGYSGIKGGFTSMYRAEGLSGMYKGMGATMMRDAPYSGAFVMAYEFNKGVYRQASEQDTYPVAANLAIAISSGMFACGITHPFDVVKTLVQVQPARYGTTLAAFTQTFQERGIVGFYRGFGPRLARKSAMGGITWTLYEQIIELLVNRT